MATKIKTLEDKAGDQILPRTVSSAVTMEDGTGLEYTIKNLPMSSIKIPAEVAEITGDVAGTDLATFIINYNNDTANTLAAAEVI